jgi:hypothetical protein
MTLDESFQVAVQRLNQQGQLLNGQLLRLLEGDKDAFREIRARLISEGFAEDRFGVGLGRRENAPEIAFPQVKNQADQAVIESSQEAERTSDDETNDDWYLMASGVIQGPMTFGALCEMRMCGEIQLADVVKKGAFGFWQRPDDVPELMAIKPNQRQRSAKIPVQEQVELPTFSKEISRFSSPGSKLATEETGFYFWESGRSIGPVSRNELLDRLKAGRLSRDEFVRVGIEGEWQPVSAIIAETNLVTSLPPNDSGGRLREPTQAKHDELRNADLNFDSLTTTHSTLSPYERSTRKQITPSSPSNPAASERTSPVQQQKREQAPSSLSDVDIEQPDARPGFEAPMPSVPKSSKRLTETRPVSSVNPAPAEAAAAKFGLSKSTIRDLWGRASHAVGGEKRLTGIIMAVAVVFSACLWMRQPPSANSIYQEFNRYHQQITELKTRGVNDQTQWKREVARALSRTESLVAGLKDPRTGASALRPAKQELLWAAQNSLLKMLESPNIDVQTVKGFEEQFEYHMNQARRLLDGGTRSVPKEFVSKANRPNDSGPPRAGIVAPPGPPIKPATPSRP